MQPKFLKHIQSELPELNKASILIAVSGGVDSMVLLHLMQQTSNKLAVAHCNFGLRGSESDADAQMVQDYCNSHKITCHVGEFDTKLPKKSTQMAARQLRYDWFKELCKAHQYDFVLTAHHADDVLETFLINLSRGTGIGGLKGIPMKSGHLLRPLLAFQKKEILSYASQYEIPWREDLSNNTDDYLRNRIRHHVVPAFCDISPDAFQQSLVSIEQTSLAVEALEMMTQKFKETLFTWDSKLSLFTIDVKALEELTPSMFWLHHLFFPFGFDAKEVAKLLKSHSGKKLISNDCTLEKGRGVLLLHTSKMQLTLDSIKVPEQGISNPLEIQIKTTTESLPESKDEIIIDADKVKFPMTLRKWQSGDLFYPIGMNGRKKVSKFFKDQKWNSKEKMAQWLLCSGDDIIWIVGQRADRRFFTKNNTPKLKLTLL
ncbi:MAG: tRNA lysidine(34) synthetase TilS [Flavobacteriaceae bacterium]|nr:tRNA lysidine(34) synthetase TilS [Flavobacteriaceae bacterium]